MKRTIVSTILILLSGSLVVTSVAGAVCEMKTDYTPGVACASSTVVVNNDAELDAYLADFGFNGNKYQNLKLNYDVTRANIDIHSPCKITLKDNVILSGDSICLDGRNGVVDDNGYTANAAQLSVLSELGDAHFGRGSVINANELTLSAWKKAKIGINSQVNVTGAVKLVSSGDLASSDAIIRQGSTVNADSLLVQAPRGATLGLSTDINVSGKVSVISTGSYTGSLAKIKQGAAVSANNLDLISDNKAALGLSTVIAAADNFTMQAASPDKCSIAGSASINAGSTWGNCLQPLVVDITSPAAGSLTNSPTISVSGTVTDLNASVTVNDIPATVANTGFSVDNVPLSEGPNTITATATDPAGNTSAHSINITLDTIIPDIGISSPANGSTIDSNLPLVIMDYSDAGAGIDSGSFQASINGVDYTASFTVTATQASYQLIAPLPEGANTVTAGISDLAGNSASTTSSFTVSIAPQATESSGFIHGQVFDVQTKLPIEGAVVTVAGIGGNILSDLEGKFVFPTPGTGIYKLKITKDGYNYNQRLAEVVSTRDTTVAPAYLLAIDTTDMVIASQGASLTNSTGDLQVDIPPDSLPYDAEVHLTLITEPEQLPSPLPDGYAFINFFYGEPSVQFDPPATVRFYNRLGFEPGATLTIVFWNRQELVWEERGMAWVTEDGQWIQGDWPSFSSGGITIRPIYPEVPCPDPNDPDCPPCDPNDPNCGEECVPGDPDCPDSCLNPGFAGSGFVSTNYALPSINALGASSGLRLTYNSNAAYPTVSIPAIVYPRGTFAITPDSINIAIEAGGESIEKKFAYNNQVSRQTYLHTPRVAVDGQTKWFASGTYPYNVKISNDYKRNEYAVIIYSIFNGVPFEPVRTATYVIEDKPVSYSREVSGRYAVVNHIASPFGSGWTIQGLSRLHFDPNDPGGNISTVMLDEGSGNFRVYTLVENTPITSEAVYTSQAGDFSTLMRHSDGSYTRKMHKGGMVYNYNHQGLLTSKVDSNGNTTNYIYDAQGLLIRIENAIGGATNFSYDANGHISDIQDAAGRVTQFNVDTFGNLVSITAPDGNATSYAYDANHLLTTEQNPRGASTQYVYDNYGRLKQTISPAGATEQLYPDYTNGLINELPGNGTLATHFNFSDVESRAVNALGQTKTVKTNTKGFVIQKTDALGNITSYERNCACGAPTKITYPNGRVVTMTYDANGNLLTRTEEATGAATTYTYEPDFNQVASITDPRGNVTQMTYDANGNLIQTTDALGNITSMSYNAQGQLTHITNALNETTIFSYNPATGNLLSITDPLGNATSYTYDAAGNLLTSTDAEGHITSYTYDAMNRLLRVTDSNNNTTNYEYDATGNLIKVTDAKGQITQFAYNEDNMLVSATNPLGYTRIYSYDANRNLVSTTDAESQTINYAYDALNRLIQKTLPDNSTTDYRYDEAGNLLNIYAPRTLIVMEYDLLGRLKSSSTLVNTRDDEFANYVSLPANTVISSNDTSYDNTDILIVDGAVITIDGTHTFKNIAIINGGKLTHSAGSHLDITADAVLIDSTSSIDMSGRGYAPGYTLGNSAIGASLYGAGGSYGGVGGIYSPTGSVSNDVYGDYRNPNELGSGSSYYGNTGAAGGGLVRIVANSLTLDGTINANGNTSTYGGGGSGGGIRLDVGTMSGVGSINALGGNGGNRGGGGGGRIALYYTADMAGFTGSISAYGGTGNYGHGGAGTVYMKSTAQAYGDLIVANNGKNTADYSTPLRTIGFGYSDSIIYSPASGQSTLSDATAAWPQPDAAMGALGLIGLELNPNTIQSQTYTVANNTATTIIVDGNITSVATSGDAYIGEYTFDNLYVRGKARLSTEDDIYVLGTIEVDNASLKANALNFPDSNQLQAINGIIEVSGPLFEGHANVILDGDSLTVNSITGVDSLALTNGAVLKSFYLAPLEISVADLTIDSTSSIDVSGQGYAGGYTLGNTTDGASLYGAGGSYGGRGGVYTGNSTSNQVYGDYRDPNEFGSGSSYYGNTSAAGGGLIRIVANSLTLDGTINANGNTSTYGGGGSGGGIRLDVGSLSGVGSINAIGADGSGRGGGGGGRIAVYYTDNSGFTGSIIANGGKGYSSGYLGYGGAGTIYLKSTTQTHGDLMVDNIGQWTADYSTPLQSIDSGVSDSIIYSPIINQSILTDANANWPLPDTATGAS